MKHRKGGEMYIPEFACGFIAGAVTAVAVLIVIAIATNKKKK